MLKLPLKFSNFWSYVEEGIRPLEAAVSMSATIMSLNVEQR